MAALVPSAGTIKLEIEPSERALRTREHVFVRRLRQAATQPQTSVQRQVHWPIL